MQSSHHLPLQCRQCCLCLRADAAGLCHAFTRNAQPIIQLLGIKAKGFGIQHGDQMLEHQLQRLYAGLKGRDFLIFEGVRHGY